MLKVCVSPLGQFSAHQLKSWVVEKLHGVPLQVPQSLLGEERVDRS